MRKRAVTATRRRRGGRKNKKHGGKQVEGGQQPVVGSAPTPLAAATVRSTDVHSTTATVGLTKPSASDTSSASAPLGTPGAAAASPPRLFKLPPAGKRCPLPDASLPYEFRLGHKEWEAVELYDRWLHGEAIRDADWEREDTPPEEREELDQLRAEERADPEYVAGPLVDFEVETDVKGPCRDQHATRVTLLLHRFSPHHDRRFSGYEPGEIDDGTKCIDASRPISEQLAKFCALGWGPSLPSALEIVRRMVSVLKADLERDRSFSPGRRYARTRAEWDADEDGYAHLREKARAQRAVGRDLDGDAADDNWDGNASAYSADES